MTATSTFEIVMGVVLLSLWAILPLAVGAMSAFSFRRGIEFVSEPSKRATPVTAWSMFGPRVLRRMRWPLVVLALGCAALSTGPVWSGEETTWANYILSALISSIPLSYVLLHTALLLLVAPRIRSALALALVCCGGAVVCMLAVTAAGSLLPRSMTYIDLMGDTGWVGFSPPPGTRPLGGLAGFSTLPGYLLIFAVVACALAAWRARRMGEAWFRFPE